ncbi:MAG: hypothetical protein GXY01_02755 [Clostridiales bacterium]|jgi:hypothetical protein|nr:hypothetical protein [Clostridiales bacterium]
MELKLKNGQYQRGEYQGLAEVNEIEELLQRINMKLMVHRGSFIPLPDYGSRLYLLSRAKPSYRQIAARKYVLEALADETELVLETLELIDKPKGEVLLYLSFTYRGKYTVDLETEI